MKRIDLQPFELQVFVKLTEVASFRMVADHFGLSQPAVSRTISRIEQRVGARLFDRTSRSVVTTPQGAALLPIAKRVIHDLTTSIDEIAHSISSTAGHVTVAALPSVAAALLPPVFLKLQRDYPDIIPSIVDTLLDGVTSAVVSGEVDFGIAVEPSRPVPGLEYRPLAVDRFIALLPQSHSLTSRRRITWSDLSDYPFAAMSHTTSVRQFTDHGFGTAGCHFNPAFEVSHLASAGALVQSGLAVTALPELALKVFDRGNTVTRELADPVITRSICLILRSNRTLSRAADLLCERLRTV